MDNLETAENIKNIVDNAGKMSFETTGVSPKNNDKENSKIFDDFMMCDDDDSAIHDDDNARNNDNNPSITDELVSEEIPPKYDTLSCSEISSAFESPKSKKRKIPRFDELLEKLHFNALFMNFTKFLHFLESPKKELTFAFIEKENEEFFEMIVQDMNILRSKILDADYRDICDNIILAASPYLLTCAYEYKPEFHNIVMVIKKQCNVVMDWSDNGTSPVCCSKENEMQSYPTSCEIDNHGIQSRAQSPGPVPSSFIINCLRTTLAFVKNDITNTKEFPELNSEQARFTQLLLESIIAFTKFDNNLEIKELYRALWEAVRIYSLKYEFRIKCEETTDDKKSLMFEKVPKNKTPVTAVNAKPIINPAILEPPKLEAAKPATAKPAAAKPATTKPATAKPATAKPATAKPAAAKPAAAKPAAARPAAAKPAAAKPAVAKPAVAKPATAKPTTAKPATAKPAAAKPEATNPVAANPESAEPELLNSSPVYTIPVVSNLIPSVMFDKVPINKPPVSENQIMIPAVSEPPTLEAAKPKAAKPEAAKPKAAKLEAAKPDAAKPKAAKPEAKNPESAELELSNARPVFAIPVVPNLIPELSYIKTINKELKVPMPQLAQRYRKKKKINLQNALQVAEADNIKLETVINLNQSFRSKKKNKKQKKAKLKASKEAAVKAPTLARPNYTWADASSSTSSSRGTSRDRSKMAAEAQNLSKTLLNEKSPSSKNTLKEPRRGPARRAGETIRKEQLMEAMSVPVQSDKAMRMMRGMGWCGGALGTRGDGITEPLMPVLDIARGAGFGHGSSSQFGTKATKPRKSKTAASDETGKTATDIITQKSKQLLLDNLTVEPHIPKESNVDIPISHAELQKAIKTAVDLANVEPKKHVMERTEFMKMHKRVRVEVLHTIYELLTSDATLKTLKYDQKISYRERKFLKMAPAELKSGHNDAIFHEEEQIICKEIKNLFQKLPEVVIEAYVAFDAKQIEIKKTLLTEVEIPKQDISLVTHLSREANKAIPLEDKIHSYIISSGTKVSSPKAYGTLKFKLLFLTNVFNFVQSSDEEVEIDFHKLLNANQKFYIENVIDEVNMRITFGSSPGEIDLCEGIKNHLSEDEILGAILNHQFTSVTLNKYYVFNRPPVKSKSQGSVKIISDRLSKPKLNTNEPTVTENNDKNAENNRQTAEMKKVPENSSANVAYKNNAVASLPVIAEANKSDHNANIEDHSDDKNNKLCTEPKLPPGEKGINISKFTNLHDEEKTNTGAIEDNNNINNNSASKSNSNVTENKNTNNVGNGNVVIDNNDNQVIDMKRSGYNNNTNEETTIVDTEMAEYVMCVDYTEEAVNRQEITVDISNEKEINITEDKKDKKKDGGEIDPSNEHSDLVKVKDVEKKDMKEEENVEVKDVIEIENQHKEIGFDIEKMIDEVLPDTNITIDQNVAFTEDTNVCTDTKGDIQNNHNLNDKKIEEEIDVIMYEMDDEPMEVISVTEVIDEKEAVELIKQDESSKDVEVGKMEEENGIKPSDDKIVKLDVEMKTDGDIISNEKIVLSEDICDTHSVGLSHVKNIDREADFHISKDTEIKTVRIVHTNHPIGELASENIKEIQRHISNSIMMSSQLPLLKCHGVQDGALIYSCHNKNTYDWLQNIISVASYVKVLDTEITRLALKLYSFFDFDTNYLFKMIELYNQGLSTKDWVVEEMEKYVDKIVFIVSMDKFSVNYIQESDLALFAGIDKVQFSLLWE